MRPPKITRPKRAVFFLWRTSGRESLNNEVVGSKKSRFCKRVDTQRSEIVTFCTQGYARVSPCASTKNNPPEKGGVFLWRTSGRESLNNEVVGSKKSRFCKRVDTQRSEIVTFCTQGYARVSPCASTKNNPPEKGGVFLWRKK